MTVEGPDGIRPVMGAVVAFDDGPPTAEAPPVVITCSATVARPAVAAIGAGTSIRVKNDHVGLVAVRVDGADGLPVLSATLVSRGQITPPVRLEAGRARVRCAGSLGTPRADVMVLGHAAFVQTAQDGTFLARRDGSGGRVRIWHPALGTVDYAATATIGAPVF